MAPQTKPARRYVLNNPPPSLRPKIISPYTGRPLVEDFMGAEMLNKLIRMLEGDKRLTDEMKHEVMVRVIARREEIESGARTLGDVAAFEADVVIRQYTH